MNKLKKELFVSERDLIREKAKRDYIENNINQSINNNIVHKWRNLVGESGPSIYDLIIKVYLLQKRLITKTEKLIELEMKFNEKDNLFIELVKYLSRRIKTNEEQTILNNLKDYENKKIKVLKTDLAETRMMLQFKQKINK
jgi:hypothetical protein